MKLHWSPRSPFVRKVMIFLHEIDMVNSVKLERSRVAMTEPNPNVMKDNPLNKIPTLVMDNGWTLFDSRVICEYLDALHSKEKLFPVQTEFKWKALRYQAFGDGMLDALVLWRNELSKPSPLSELCAAFELKINTSLDKLEEEVKELSELPFCIGHISVGCSLGYMDFRFQNFDWRKDHEELAKWHKIFEGRPSVQATKPSEG